jgi:hypothetical protein
MATRTAAVALVVLLAGCSLLGGGTGAETGTVTPLEVPTETTEGPTLPPGVTGAGVVDVDALVRAHVRAAASTSYVWVDRERRFYGNGSSLVSFERRVTFVNGTTYHRVLDPRPMFARGVYDRPRDEQRYADGRWLYRFGDSTSAEPAYRVEPATDASRRLARLSGESVGIYLAVPNATVSVTRVDGRRYYEVTAHRDRYPIAIPLVGDVYDYSVEAVVAPSGFVGRLNATYRTDPEGGANRVRYSFAFTEVGSATLTEPPWLPAARARTDPTATAAP